MLTIHHLQVSQSERILWLCEELGVPYDLKLYQRNPLYSPPELQELTPLGAAPVITDGSLKLAESGAIVDYIINIHGSGRLALPPSHPDYATYLYWYHVSNGNLQPVLGRCLMIRPLRLPPSNPLQQNTKDRLERILDMYEARFTADKATWLAGDEFSAADIMTVFSLSTMRCAFPLDLSKYPGIVAWLGRCGEREAYKRAMAKGDPEADLGRLLSAEGPELLGPMRQREAERG